jgi:hypothetical protein
MWKIVVAFVAFAALAMFVLMKSGGDIDMSGEKHGIDAGHTEEAHSSAPAAAASLPASEPAPAAVASEAASGASQ